MFLSYCLKYAGIPQSAIPQEASVLALRSSMSDMDWLLDGEDGSAANVGDIVIYNKYVTRTVAVDSSADGAADGLDDLFSMDAEGENGAELETSGASALDAAPAADSVITPDLPDTANPEQPAAKPADSTGTSASGADTLIPSVSSPAAEPQTTTVTDAQPVETVGIVSETDENTLTVISGDVDGKVAEVTLSNAEVLAVVDVAAAQYADEMLTTAVTGALQAPGMLMLAGAEETASTTASASIKTALDGAPYITVFKLQKEKNKQYAGEDAGWFGADVLQAVIGQSLNKFTPLQLVCYTSALANKGTRYEATLLSRVVSWDYQDLIEESKPVVASTLNISEKALAALDQGMRMTATIGTAEQYLRDYPIPIACKTGTAQWQGTTSTGAFSGSDHASFVLYAPADDPEIAIAVYVERGSQGGNLANVCIPILDAYFSSSARYETVTTENIAY